MQETIPPGRPYRRLLPGVLMLMAAVLLLGYALRVYHLDVKDMWVDEAHVWWHSALPLIEGVAQSVADGPRSSAADPLYGILLHVWIQLTGESLFALRYFSVLAHVITVAYLGRVAARAFGWRVGHVALIVGAAAPIWVLFSQEIRPYALTPLVMLVMVEAVIEISQAGGRGAWPWINLMVGETLALYTHGFMIVGVLVINLWLGWIWLRRLALPGRIPWLQRWFASQLGVLILILPLVPTYLGRLNASQNPFFTPLSVPDFANALWGFLLGIPWEQQFDMVPMHLLVTVTLVLVWAALAVFLRRPGARPLADLIWLVFGIAAASMLYSWNNPTFHGRYVMFLAGPLFIVLAVLLVEGWEAGTWGRRVSVGLSLALLILSFVNVWNIYTGPYPGYRHHATRAVSDALKAQFGSQDGIIVMAVHDYTLDYYGHGQAELTFARFNQGADTPTGLLDFMHGKQSIGVLRIIFERPDLHQHVPFYLERFGSLIRSQLFEGYTLLTYQLDPQAQPAVATFEPAALNWGSITLVGQSVQSGDAVTVAFQLRTAPDFVASPRYAASLRLVDPMTGWTLSIANDLLIDENGNPTSEWQPSQRTTQYFVLPLQPGTPPIEADVILTLYDSATGQALDLRDENGAPAGQEATLSRVTLGPAPQTWAYDDDQRPWELTPVSSQLLSGYAIDKPVTSPGGTLGVTLGWLATPDEVEDRQVRLQLMQGETVLAEDNGPILQGRHPAGVQTGQPWLDHRLLQVSRDAQPGPVDLVLWAGEEKIVLGTVEVVGFERITQRPEIEYPLEATFGDSIRLLGYRLDVPDPLTSDSVVTLTLYWQALADGRPDAGYKVFTQILGADGRLVGQHDGVPVYESRPFSGWLASEYIVDEHPMKFIGPYSGPVRIQVGLYDPVTMLRVLTSDGLDAVALPVELEVESGD